MLFTNIPNAKPSAWRIADSKNAVPEHKETTDRSSQRPFEPPTSFSAAKNWLPAAAHGGLTVMLRAGEYFHTYLNH
jgi:hypothetical protein